MPAMCSDPNGRAAALGRLLIFFFYVYVYVML